MRIAFNIISLLVVLTGIGYFSPVLDVIEKSGTPWSVVIFIVWLIVFDRVFVSFRKTG